MRASIYLTSAAALALAAGCTNTSGANGNACQADTDCDSGICARTQVCVATDHVQAVRATWTVAGAPPTAASCTSLDPLTIEFFGSTSGSSRDDVAFAPVPCAAGLFSIDKLPDDIDTVSLGPSDSRFKTTALIDASGNAKLDLP